MGEAVDYFAQSTQAKHWIFDDEDSLFDCRRQACEGQPPLLLTTTKTTITETSWNKPSHKRARKFACGYNKNKQTTTKNNNDNYNGDIKATTTTSSSNPHLEETLVQFHTHQLQRLIGPNAMLPELRRDATVLSTAMMLLRRFYLSNSVVDFHPRNMAAAAALLAVKVDCEPNLPIDVLSHATLAIHAETTTNHNLCRDELKAVTVHEIEEAERALMEGCDYRLRCHHPHKAIRVLAQDVVDFMTTTTKKNKKDNDRNRCSSPLAVGNNTAHNTGFIHPNLVVTTPSSPTTTTTSPHPISPCASPRCSYDGDDDVNEDDDYDDNRLDLLCERALSIVQTSMIYSDAPFLFAPGQIAFAAVALALDGPGYRPGSPMKSLGLGMHDYLFMRFQKNSPQELSNFEGLVVKILSHLEGTHYFASPMQLAATHYGISLSLPGLQDEKIARSLRIVARLRCARGAVFQPMHHARANPSSRLRHDYPLGHYHHNARYEHQWGHPPQYHHYGYHDQHHLPHPPVFRYANEQHGYGHGRHGGYVQHGYPFAPFFQYQSLHADYQYHGHHQQHYQYEENSSCFTTTTTTTTTTTSCGRKRRMREEEELLGQTEHLSQHHHQQQQQQQQQQPSHHYASRKIARVTPITVPSMV